MARSRTVLGLLSLLTTLSLLVAACSSGGGVDNGSVQGDTNTDSQDVTNTAAQQSSGSAMPEGINLPEGMPTADGLIPELAEIPLPDGGVFGKGTAYTKAQDPRETAVQVVYFTQSAEEIVTFYLDALPANGFQIESQGSVTEAADIQPNGDNLVLFTDPDGLSGSLDIKPGAFSPAQLSINLSRSG
jgi:hypothetical protein